MGRKGGVVQKDGKPHLRVVHGKDDPAEFVRLYRENYERVRNYVLYRMAGSSDAEDVVAEAFLKAARAFHRFDSERSSFSTWVISIARNCVADYWRKLRIASPIDDAPESMFAANDEYPGLDESKLRVQELLVRLNPDERELVYMKYYAEMKNVEIAEKLGMNASTIASKLQRALQKMRAEKS